MLKPQKYSKFLVPSVIATSIMLVSSMNVTAAVLEEIVVTAQKRSENLQDVPISVSALSGAKMEEAGITRIADLQAYIPNLSMTEGAIGNNIFIRGIGSQVNQGFEQSVGTYVDGVYYGRALQLLTPFFDLERVEVLRGPQSILFGKNSIAGALNIVTAKPRDEFFAEISALYEPDHNEREYSLIVSGPLSDTFGARLAIRKRDIDGYVDNVFLGRDESSNDELVVRSTFNWAVSDDFNASLKIELGEYDTDGRTSVIVGAALPGRTPVVNDFGVRATNTKEFSTNEYDNYTLQLDYNVGENTLTSITGFSSYDYEALVDADFSVAPIIGLPSEEDYDQFSQEIRLVSSGDNTFDYIVGGFYQTSELTFNETIILTLPAISVNVPRTYSSDSDLWSIFGQGTFNVSDSLRVTLGLRYTEEDKEGGRKLETRNPDGSVFPVAAFAPLGASLAPFGITTHDLKAKRSEESLTPSLNVQFDASENAMLYAIISTGFKAGGFDARTNRATNPLDNSPAIEFEEEEALAFELGAKLSFLDGAAELNFALFRTEYEDLQVSVFDGVLGFDVQNAAEAVSQGLEIDGRWQATDHLMLSAGVGFIDFEFGNYENGACFKGQTPDKVVNGTGFCKFDGNTNQLTPEWSANFSANFSTPIGETLEFRAVVDLQASDDYFAAPDLDPNLIQDSFVKVNARLSVGDIDGKWDVALVGRNLTDEKIITFGNDVALSGPVQSYFVFVERPVTIALQGSYRF